MLFSKNQQPRCAYCQRATPFGKDQVLCIKRGVLSVDDACDKFRYDPLKRVPPRPATPDFSRLCSEDFTL